MSRVDKKKKVAPHLPGYVVRHVHAVRNHLFLKSDSDAGVLLTMTALHDHGMLEQVSPYLARAYAVENNLFPGYRDHLPLDNIIRPDGLVLERFSMRFEYDDWARLDALGFALASAVAHAVATLLNLAYATPRITNIVAPDFFTPSEYALEEMRPWASSTRVSPSRV